HGFYNAHKILQTLQQDDYLYVLKVVSHSLTFGLKLLGISAKTKM
ncbi:DALR anticodon-binding domain-containing protein, partial [uncultured Helicobacter sp.]